MLGASARDRSASVIVLIREKTDIMKGEGLNHDKEKEEEKEKST